MEKKKKSLITSAVAAASLVAMSQLNASTSKIEMNVLGSGAEVRSEILTHKGVSKMLNDLKCGENKTDAKAEKSKGKEGKCGEGKCGEKKAKGKEGKCGEGKCGEKKKSEGKCGEKKSKEQPK